MATYDCFVLFSFGMGYLADKDSSQSITMSSRMDSSEKPVINMTMTVRCLLLYRKAVQLQLSCCTLCACQNGMEAFMTSKGAVRGRIILLLSSSALSHILATCCLQLNAGGCLSSSRLDSSIHIEYCASSAGPSSCCLSHSLKLSTFMRANHLVCITANSLTVVMSHLRGQTLSG